MRTLLDARVNAEADAHANEIVGLFALRRGVDLQDEHIKAALELARLVSEVSFLDGILYAVAVLSRRS